MEIKVSRSIGFCYGVKRALDLSRRALLPGKGDVYSVGPIIHNPQVVEELLEKGLKSVDYGRKIKTGTLIISSHGAGASLKKRRKKGIDVIDATCPFVRNIQECVAKLHSEGYKVVIVGQHEHPEVRGLVEVAQGKALVIKDKHEARQADLGGARIGVVSQSTYSQADFLEITSALLTKRFSEIRIFDTICRDTLRRQDAARRLADATDAVVVIGGKNSANTKRLVEICRKGGKAAYHIEKSSEIRQAWFRGKRRVGVVSGASTPDRVVREIIKKMERSSRQW